jgi:beta-lactamase class D
VIWVERPNGAVFFAIDIDTPNREADLPELQALLKAALQGMQARGPSP